MLKKYRISFIILGIFFVFIMSIWVGAYYFINHANPAKIISLPLVQKKLVKELGLENKSIIADLPDWLGLTRPRLYLILFLNNTELRPGGGFIGSYAVLRLENGRPSILKVEGTETIDRAVSPEKLAAPPFPLGEHLGVNHWYFRDSNWSPDFALSSQKTLELYIKENGVAADSIDAVIGVTTHVLEEIMLRTDPITVNGLEFTAENVIEKLEYEVEYGYRDRGIDFKKRKETLGELFHELVRRVGPDILKNPRTYVGLIDKMAVEKHLLAYSPQSETQARFVNYGWDGSFAPTTTDYVWWIDANLAALKTDHAVRRELSYEFSPDKTGNFVATTTMTYSNTGVFDWRTTRYRTYARLYVPKGAQLQRVVGAMKWDRNIEPGKPTITEDLNSAVFGAFISIEPGTTKSLSFVYTLPAGVVSAIKNKDYSLSIPKQLGATPHALTLSLNFGTNITSAVPAEDPKNWGDARYSVGSDLRVDRYFFVK